MLSAKRVSNRGVIGNYNMWRSSLLIIVSCFASGVLGATSVIHIVVDDLGRSDLGFRNNMTHSPTLDKMATEGVILGSHYVFQVCAPTRASILTGRYPWGIGFYVSRMRPTVLDRCKRFSDW